MLLTCWFACYHVLWRANLVGASSVLEQTNFAPERLAWLRNRTASLFFHAWDNYVEFALPADELKPLSCTPLGPDANVENIERNDVLGNYSVTLIDSLDSLAILGRADLFARYVDYVKTHVSFDVPSVVQVFEVTIRAMGGLLSAHIYASVPELGCAIPGYDGHLLAKAYDLGIRLLPAFETETGIPHPRVHLQKGIVPIGKNYITGTCSAAAGSLLLEFGMLSRLTGDERFEALARRAFMAVWDRRSELDLVSWHVDSRTGKWLEPFTGVGASVDSLYEYALKYYILFDDKEYLDIWTKMESALDSFSFNGWFYRVIDFRSGVLMTYWFDALAAFWSGVQVLAGNVSKAIQAHIIYQKLWNNFGGIPERFSVGVSAENSIELEWYLLRPEFIESAYYLFQATKDPLYLQIGEVVLDDFEHINKVPCGVAALHDVRTGELSDKMESFFLSETLKYLYILFDTEHSLHRDSSTWVFSTEAHPFWNTPTVMEHANVSNFPELGIAYDGLCSSSIKNFTVKPIAAKKRGASVARKKADVQNRPPVCEAYPNYNSESFVLSWEHFYMPDVFLNFTKPEWLYRRTDIEFHNSFYRRYILDNSYCAAINHSSTNGSHQSQKTQRNRRP